MKRGFSVIGFTVGVMLILLNIVNVSIVPFICGGAAILFIASLLLPEYRKTMVVPICFGSALFACVLFLTVYYSEAAPCIGIKGQEAAATFYLTDLPKKTNNGYVYTAKAVNIFKDGMPQNIKIRVKSNTELYAQPYQLINGNLKFYSIGNKAFNSYGYWGKDIFLTARVQNYEVTDTVINRLMLNIVNMRKSIADTLITSVKGDEGAFAAAIITGDRTALSDTASMAFRRAGVTHLTAISGIHLTVITGAVYFILKKLRLNEKIISAVLIVFIIFYSALTGFSSSVVRAGIMMIVMLLSKFAGMRSDALNSLGLAVFIICLNPFAVCDVGAVLSVIAVLAICTAVPFFGMKSNRYNYGVKSAVLSLPDMIVGGAGISGAILLYSLPVLYVFFGYYSVIGIILNIVAIPLGSLSVIVSFITCFANKAGLFPQAFSFVDRSLNGLILKLINTSSNFKYALVSTNDYFGIIFAGILVLLAFCFILDNKRFIKVTAVIAVFAVLLTSVITVSADRNKVKLLICESGACAAVSEDGVFVCEIKNDSDYYSVTSFLSSENKSIDAVVVEERYSKYAVLLSDKYNCRKIITPQFSSDILKKANTDDYTATPKFSGKAGNDISYSFDYQENYSVNKLKLKQTEIVFSKKPYNKNSIFIATGKVYDYNGIIDTEKGNVIYTVSDDNIYKARRVDVWES